jgi:HPt (histidine-containing phosphotransfer) domain-containing protein
MSRSSNESARSVTQELRATLWRRVGDATIARVDDLEATFVGLGERPEDERLHTRAVGLAHAIAGSAGVYGFRDEARAASELEGLLRAWPGTDGIELAAPHLATLRDGFEEGDA